MLRFDPGGGEGGFGGGPRRATTREVYLHPGQLLVASGATTVKTILGSCVSVCLWDEVTGVGGINHFLLPLWAGAAVAPSERFGDLATDKLIADMRAQGCARMKAKVFGGACVLEPLRRPDHLGIKNAEVARARLEAAGIPVVELDVGGARGRKLTFRIEDGATCVVLL